MSNLRAKFPMHYINYIIYVFNWISYASGRTGGIFPGTAECDDGERNGCIATVNDCKRECMNFDL